MLSRLAIGRFIGEAITNLDSATNYTAKEDSTISVNSMKLSDKIKNNVVRRQRFAEHGTETRPGTGTRPGTDSRVISTDDLASVASGTSIPTENGKSKNKNTNKHSSTSSNTDSSNVDTTAKQKQSINTEKLDQQNYDSSKSIDHNIFDNEMKNLSKSEFHSKYVSTETKMLIYSGHDSTMVPLLRAIGLYHGKLRINIFDNENE